MTFLSCSLYYFDLKLYKTIYCGKILNLRGPTFILFVFKITEEGKYSF